MNQQNNAMQLHNENISESKLELQELGAKVASKSSFAIQKAEMLQRHMDEMVANNKTWIDRLFLPAEEKKMLNGYVEKQTEAVNIILDNQNQSLAAMCSGQVTFVKEVVNTLLKTGRAGLKAGADLIYMEYGLQRAARLEQINIEFYNHIERKMADAETRTKMLQEMKLEEAAADLRNWRNDYKKLQDEFSDILKEQV